MATISVQHPELGATFNGVVEELYGEKINKFKGIKYADIPARFERAQPVTVEQFNGKTIDATKYGPRCPQAHVDVRHLLRIPEDYGITDEPEDELQCLNLDVTVPSTVPAGSALPVVVWIYGGSQAVTFCSAASGICDPARIVADSAKAGRPIIFVGLHYRLNIFAFGDGNGSAETNLGLKDQRLAIDWVRKYIAGFGGDPESITLCGESAGAICVHAHLHTGPPIKRAIMMSGSMTLSPPLPRDFGKPMLMTLENRAQTLEGKSLRDCSPNTVKQILEENNVTRVWLQEDEELKGWGTDPEQVEELMIGDTEFESVVWRRGIEAMETSEIVSIFEGQHSEWGAKLRKLYHIVSDRPTASSSGALDFVTDARYALPAEVIAEKLTDRGKKVYRYVVDETNPWQASARSHHAVDLIFLFGTVDGLSRYPEADAVGQDMRDRWIKFVNGEAPWTPMSTGKRFAFGPYGECKEIDERQFAARRRVAHMKVLKEAGFDVYGPIMNKLIAGRISLLN